MGKARIAPGLSRIHLGLEPSTVSALRGLTDLGYLSRARELANRQWTPGSRMKGHTTCYSAIALFHRAGITTEQMGITGHRLA